MEAISKLGGAVFGDRTFLGKKKYIFGFKDEMIIDTLIPVLNFLKMENSPTKYSELGTKAAEVGFYN
jgi:hypothetical protein